MNHQDPVLGGYEPALVLKYFEEICAIPHVSGDERALSDYVVAFAVARGLSCSQDASYNVFVSLPATPGCEDAPVVMLQGHLDMVGEKDADSAHDFARDGLDLFVETVEDTPWVGARGTTLGGDDGIAVAMMLAILDSPPAAHPALECLFTVSEETGLEGAWGFDPAAAGSRATLMINLDSEAEGVLTAGCSGGMRSDLEIPVATEPCVGVALTVSLGGFSGGHSGVEIHEGHTNAIKALGRLLRACGEHIRLADVRGGGKDNAIPRDATATVVVPQERAALVRDILSREAACLRGEPQVIPADRDFYLTVTPAPAPVCMLTRASHCAVLAAMDLMRDGVLSMNAHVEGLVAYSRNLGIVTTLFDEENIPTAVRLSASTRSAVASHLDDSERELAELSEVLSAVAGASVQVSHRGRYPGWDYAPVSPLRELWLGASETLFGVRPRIEVIHAGLECGILCDKMTAMGQSVDIISVGPDMRDIHTPRERLSIPSVARVYALLTHVVTCLSKKR